MADVVSREEVARIRALVLYEGSGERWDAEELADSHEQLRARLESAEAALREAERGTMRCLTVGGSDRYWWRCDLCEQRHLDGSTTPHHKPTCPFAALGAASERSGNANPFSPQSPL